MVGAAATAAPSSTNLRPFRAALTRSLGSVLTPVQGALGTALVVEDGAEAEPLDDAAAFAA